MNRPMEELKDYRREVLKQEIKAGARRQLDFLRPLNRGMIVLQLIALTIILTVSETQWSSFTVLVASLFLNALTLFLRRRGRLLLASHIFCHNFNIVIFLMLLKTLSEHDRTGAVLFSCMLALGVLLSGMLLGNRATFVLVVLNTLLIVIPTFTFVNAGDAINMAVPASAFLILVGTVTWLFQRSLAVAQASLRAANQQIMHDELLRRDLEIALDLQRRLYPPPPQTGGVLEVVSCSQPARETSGDFYDFIDLGQDRLGVVMGDVSGKSLPAALIMAMARSTLRVEAQRAAAPAQALAQANQIFYGDPAVNQFVTAFYGIFDLRTLTLQFANAGHLYPILRRAGQVAEIEINGMILGAFPGVIYEERTLQLLPGDELILLSDGVVEERNRRREIFGYERLLEIIRRTDGCAPRQLLDEVQTAVATFREDTAQDDDITMVVVRVTGAARDVAQHTDEQVRATPLEIGGRR